MSKYTTELRYICEKMAGLENSEGYESVDKIVALAAPKIFDFAFPIFDPDYKTTLCEKILKHYYTREIGEETVGLWKLRLNVRMNEIMPYYNQLYKSELIEFNPMYDVDLTTQHDESEGSNTNKVGKEKIGFGEHKTSETVGSENAESVENVTDNITENSTTDNTGNETENRTKTSSTDETYADITAQKEHDTDVTESTASKTRNVTDNATTDTTNTETTTSKDLYSDTPQGAITDLESESYLTNARKISGDKEQTGHNAYQDTITETNNDTETKSDTVDKQIDGSKNSNASKNTSETENSAKEIKNDTAFNKTGKVISDKTGTDTVSTSNNVTADTSSEENRDNTETVGMTGFDKYIQTLKGKSSGVSYSKMLQEFRETFLNIDMMVIENLSDLFINLW